MTFDTAPNPPAPPRVLRRCPHGRMLGGVAAGAADYLDVDPVTVRIALVLLALVGGVAIPLYIAAWLLIPEEGSEMSIAEHLLHHDGRL
ncbi:MAG: PspC domain-containing protein [Actinomycetota bacterium]|nr:PspC domain-containing protein [Actinomycetota bacterium]